MQVRGVFANPNADRRLDITLYGEQQLADYAEMMDWFGYSGCQMMETSYSYGVFGSVAAFQSWQKRLAKAVRENGQELSLWVWAAQFSGFNWRDPDVLAVTVPSKGAFEDPATRRIFEKYYDHYADLAPLADLLIGHFYDPGVLADRDGRFQVHETARTEVQGPEPAAPHGHRLLGRRAGIHAAADRRRFSGLPAARNRFPDGSRRSREASPAGEAARPATRHLGLVPDRVRNRSARLHVCQYPRSQRRLSAYPTGRHRHASRCLLVGDGRPSSQQYLLDVRRRTVAVEPGWRSSRIARGAGARHLGSQRRSGGAQGPGTDRRCSQRADLGNLLVDHASVPHRHRSA